MKKLFLALALTLGLIGCKSNEPKEPSQLKPAVSLTQMAPKPEKPKKDFRKKIEQLIQEHKIPYIDSIHIYTKEHKQELFDAIREKYGYGDEEITQYKKVLDKRQNLYGPLLMLTRDKIGQGESSLLCIMPGISNYIFTAKDLESEIADYAGYRAKDNAEGLILDNKKIGVEEINQMGPLVYQDILDLRARTYQICEIERKDLQVSQKFKEALFMKYLSTGLNLAMTITRIENLTKKGSTEYEQVHAFIQDAVNQAKQMMNVHEVKRK